MRRSRYRHNRYRRGRRGRRSKLRWFDIALIIAAVVLIGTGAYMLMQDRQAGDNIQALAEEVGPNTDGETNVASNDGINWNSILAQNPDTVAWLNVEGTSMDVPVMQTGKDNPDYYLYHDFWGKESDTGCPFLGAGYNADGTTMQVYGHCTIYNSYMFHDISDKYYQNNFNSLGKATWSTPTSLSTATFAPLCAASVSMNDSRWQIPTDANIQEARDWAVWACQSASAKTDKAEETAKKADRILALVTCNGWGWHSRTRTVVVYASTFSQVNEAL